MALGVVRVEPICRLDGTVAYPCERASTNDAFCIRECISGVDIPGTVCEASISGNYSKEVICAIMVAYKVRGRI